MNTSAIITMVLTQGIVTFFMIRFFRKVLKTPNKVEPEVEEETA